MTAKSSRKMLCPECGEPVRIGHEPFILHGVLLGEFEVHICPRCGEYSFTPSGSRAIDRVAKAKGLWGTGVRGFIVQPHPVNGRKETAVHSV